VRLATIRANRADDSSGDIPEHRRTRGSSTFADGRLDPSTQPLGSTNLVKQPSCEAVLGLTRHRKEQVFGSDDGVASRRSEFVGFTQQFFDVSRELSHGRIMTGPLRNDSRARSVAWAGEHS
jgi:hypothetical protein